MNTQNAIPVHSTLFLVSEVDGAKFQKLCRGATPDGEVIAYLNEFPSGYTRCLMSGQDGVTGHASVEDAVDFAIKQEG